MFRENGNLVDRLLKVTKRSVELIKPQGSLEEIMFIPIGILLLKWISDSKSRFLWDTDFNYKNLVECDYSQNEIIYRIIDESEKIEENNYELQGIFTDLCFQKLSYIKPKHINEIICDFNGYKFEEYSSEDLITGEFINLFLENISESISEYSFITVSSIKELLAGIFTIDNSMKIADIACGTGGILAEVMNKIRESKNTNNKLEALGDKIFGQEINFKASIMCKINLLLHGIKNFEIKTSDSLREPIKFQEGKFDVILSNLPLGQRWNVEDIRDLKNLKYGLPSKKNSEWIFIQRGLASLNATGKAAFVVSKGTLTRKTDKKIRKMVLDNNIVETIISLPNNLYGSKTIPIEILVINKNKKLNDKILFIDASKSFNNVDRGRNYLSKEHIDKIIRTYRNIHEEEGYSKIVEMNVIEMNNYELDSSFYINSKMDLLKNLQMKKLSDISQIKRGLQAPKKRFNEEISGIHHYIKISDLTEEGIQFDQKILLSDREVNSYELKPKDLIISARGVMIKTAIYDENMPRCILSGNLIRIRLLPNYNPYFLQFYLNSKRGKQLLSYIQEGATIVALNPNKLKELLIPDISIEVQNKLADRINSNNRKYEEQLKAAKKEFNQNIKEVNDEINHFINIKR